MGKRLEKKRILLLDMYGVIIKESKGYFIPYTFEHFDKTEHDSREEYHAIENSSACFESAKRNSQSSVARFFTKAGNGELSSDEFLSLLGYPDPRETMRDYLTHFLTLDQDFLWFAERNYRQYDFVLLSNDVKEWSDYLFTLHGLQKYFKERIISGEVHMRKPEKRIFDYTIQHLQCDPQECVFVDNSVQNLNTAKETGIHTVLFNRDHEVYSGAAVNNFHELNRLLKNRMGF